MLSLFAAAKLAGGAQARLDDIFEIRILVLSYENFLQAPWALNIETSQKHPGPTVGTLQHASSMKS